MTTGIEAYRQGYAAALDPVNAEAIAGGGRAVTTLQSPWLFLRCPVCDHTLASELSDDLSELDLHSASETHRVYFSRIAGEEATFVVSAEGMLKDYGIHTDRYLENLVHLKYMR